MVAKTAEDIQIEKTAVLGVLSQLETETSLPLDSLIHAIETNDEDEAAKQARDIFSGDPTNGARAFELYNQALQGLSRVNSALGDDINGEKSQETEGRAKRHAYRAFLYTLEIQREISQTIDRMIETSCKRFSKTLALANKSLEDVKDLDKRVDSLYHDEIIDDGTDLDLKKIIITHKSDLLNLADKVEALKAKDSADLLDFKNKLGQLPGRIPEFSKNILEANEKIVLIHQHIEGHPQDQHILYKDESGYYIKNPKTRTRIDIDEKRGKGIEALEPDKSLGNDLPQSTIDKFNKDYQHIVVEFEKHGLRAQVSVISEGLATIQENKRTLQHFENQIRETADKLFALEQKIKKIERKGTISPEVKAALHAEAEALHTIIHDGEERINATRATNQKSITEGLEALIQALAKAKDDQTQIHAYEAIVKQGTEQFANRPEQLNALRSGNTAAFFRKFTPFNGEYSADAYVGIVKALGWNSKIVEAWENSLQTKDGEFVYRNPEDGSLYTYDKDSDTRTTIKDPKALAALFSQAYNGDKPMFFRNETPHSEDPDNQFEDTLNDPNRNKKQTAQAIQEQVKKHAVIPQEKHVQFLKDKANQECSMQDACTPELKEQLLKAWDGASKQEEIKELSPLRDAFKQPHTQQVTEPPPNEPKNLPPTAEYSGTSHSH